MTLSEAWRKPGDSLPDPNDPQRSRCRACRCLPGEIAEFVLLPGDPARAAHIANNWLENGKLVMANREFHSYTGIYQGLAVSVISTGLGAPGAAMVVQDLPKLGVKAAIRVGTAGSAVEQVAPGDLVIATAAVRDEGVSHHFVPAEFPAAADFGLTRVMHEQAAAKAQDSKGVKTHTGIVHTSDAFSSPNLAEDQVLYSDAGVLAFEMEAAAVMVVAGINRVPAACILSIDGYVNQVAAGNTVPDAGARDRGIENAIGIALETLLVYSREADSNI